MRFATFSAAGALLALGVAHLAGAQYIVTSGVPSGVNNQTNNQTGARPYRMEINDLYADSISWYVIADFGYWHPPAGRAFTLLVTMRILIP
jgi:hypothetical protein